MVHVHIIHAHYMYIVQLNSKVTAIVAVGGSGYTVTLIEMQSQRCKLKTISIEATDAIVRLYPA